MAAMGGNAGAAAGGRAARHAPPRKIAEGAEA